MGASFFAIECWKSTAGGGDNVVCHGSDGVADEREQNWCEEVVPAGARHFAMAEDNISQQEFECDPRDVEDGRCYTGLHLLHGNIAEADALEFTGEVFDLTEGVNRPAITKRSTDPLLRTAELSGSKKAVGNNDAAAGAQDAMCFAEERGFVGASGIATAFDRIEGIEACGRKAGVLVVAERNLDAGGARAGLVECATVLKLPGDEGDAVEIGCGVRPGDASQGCAEATTYVENTCRAI